MKIGKVNIYPIRLPFSFEFSNSLRKRLSVNNIVVEIAANHGEIAGYGEGAPRSYVTGESQDSATKNIIRLLRKDTFPWEINNVSQIWNFIDSLYDRNDRHSAVCALEMALLDALAREEGKPLYHYLPQDYFTPRIYYGSVVPLTSKKQVAALCASAKEMRINKLRLKMGKNYEQNKETLEAVKMVFGDKCDLRVDVNGAWNYTSAVKHIPLLKDHKVKVIEQPFAPFDSCISEFSEQIKNHGLALMADESACSLADVKRINKEGSYGMVNLRLSKCGGFRNSVNIINYLRSNGLSFQIGCQLGESGLLSSAGRTLGILCSDALYYDGSYDKFLLKENITYENVSFGTSGLAGPMSGPGLGVNINMENLLRLSKGPPTEITPNHI
ncbi:MAG: enolase C-terminal domain-like protein [Thermodesulfobacteriota bacterium]|nr:enolase C-terminal domain-like protein [Thermodesulfobacteriota bacterium]